MLVKCFGRCLTRNCQVRTIGYNLPVLKALLVAYLHFEILGSVDFLCGFGILRREEVFLAARCHSFAASVEATIRTEIKSKLPRYLFGKDWSGVCVSKDTFWGTALGRGN